MRKFVALGTLAVMAVGAQSVYADGVSYNLVEGTYAFADIEGFDGDGFGVRGSYGFTPNIHAVAGFQSLDFDFGSKLKNLYLGAGYNWSLNDSWDLIGTATFEQQKILGASETGWGLGAGARGRVGTSVELNAGVKYTDIGDFGDAFTFVAGGRYYFTPMFAVGAEFNKLDLGDADADGEAWVISVRYDFGGM